MFLLSVQLALSMLLLIWLHCYVLRITPLVANSSDGNSPSMPKKCLVDVPLATSSVNRPAGDSSSFRLGLLVGTLNVHSIDSNAACVCDILSSSNFNVLVLQET